MIPYFVYEIEIHENESKLSFYKIIYQNSWKCRMQKYKIKQRKEYFWITLQKKCRQITKIKLTKLMGSWHIKIFYWNNAFICNNSKKVFFYITEKMLIKRKQFWNIGIPFTYDFGKIEKETNFPLPSKLLTGF